jgi:PAS domain S-box-containing protein
VLVFGDTVVVDPRATRGLPLVRREVGERLGDLVAALVVADVSAFPVEALAETLREPALDAAPVLIVASTPPSESVLELLGAADLLLETTPAATADRRVSSLVELGLGRLALSIAEQALEHSVNGLSIADLSAPDAPLVYVSTVFESLTGYSDSELRGGNCRLLQRGDTDQPGIAVLRDAVKARTRATAIVRNYRKDGSPFWNEVTIFPVKVNGRPTRWMGGVQHDVTTLHAAQAEIVELCKQLTDRQIFDHAILDGIELGIITTDGEGRITFANRAAHGILRLDSEVRDVNVANVLALEHGPNELLRDDLRITRSHTISCADGERVELDLSLTRGQAVHDERVGFFFIFRDAREAREFEAERHRFEHLVAMGTMVAGFAHEVRNPVAALRSIAEELDEVIAESGLRLPHPKRMIQVLARIEHLVHTSLQYGRPTTPKRARHRPWTILSAALAAVGPRTRQLGSEIRVEVEPELRDVYCDETQIAQALVVLLDNALDETKNPSHVMLRARMDRGSEEHRPRKSQPPSAPIVRIEVLDDGPGIPPEIVPRIFDPFFTSKAQGTGLGLSIAQKLVSENRGRLEVTSPRGPTCFAVFVPCS